jgi:hypothetical protein
VDLSSSITRVRIMRSCSAIMDVSVRFMAAKRWMMPAYAAPAALVGIGIVVAPSAGMLIIQKPATDSGGQLC